MTLTITKKHLKIQVGIIQVGIFQGEFDGGNFPGGSLGATVRIYFY